MPPFRIVTRHPDRGHPNHTWHPVGDIYTGREDLDEDLALATQPTELVEVAPAPTDLENSRERVRVTDRLAELNALGHEFKAQELVVAETGTDDAGNELATAHKWKDA